MPRYARILNEKQIYHVMLRGNNREKIFIDDDDKDKVINIIKVKKIDKDFYLYAFCIMDNHLHLVIKEGKDHVARIIKRIGISYAHYFNKKYRRIGHVFQDRYRSENVADDRYLFALIRYVHQNPVKAGIGTIEGYRWSSYREYLTMANDLVETEDILHIISNSQQQAIEEFTRFNHEMSGDTFLDMGEGREMNNISVKKIITDYLRERNLQIVDLKESCNKQVREDIIKLLVSESGLSLREIAIELGLGREIVRRAYVSKEPSP